MTESFRSRVMRWGFNWFPAFRGSGAHLTYVAADFGEARLELPLSWRTRNYVGTIFGGSMYAAVDPIYMVMLIQRLGSGYIVWDKAASIRFLKPGRSTLHARFVIDDAELATIRELAAGDAPIDRDYEIDLVDADGTVCAQVSKRLYIRRKAGSQQTLPQA